MLRCVSNQLQANRAGHQVECEEGFAVSPVKWLVEVLGFEMGRAYLGHSGVVSAPLWNSEKSKFAGMLTVLDIIHLIQYYYRTATYDSAVADVEHFKLESLRGALYLPTILVIKLISISITRHRKEFGCSNPASSCRTPHRFSL